MRFCFWEDTSEASAIFAFAFAFWGLGLAPSRSLVEFSTVVEKSLCVSLLNAFKIFGFSPSFAKIAPDVTKWSQKVWALAKTEGNFHDEKWAFKVFKCF